MMGVFSNINARANHATTGVLHAAAALTGASALNGAVGNSVGRVGKHVITAIRPKGGLRPISRVRHLAKAVIHTGLSPVNAVVGALHGTSNSTSLAAHHLATSVGSNSNLVHSAKAIRRMKPNPMMLVR